MNTIRFARLLESTLKGVPESLQGAQVWRLKRPRPLAPLMEKSLDTDEERELYAGSFEDWPGHVWELLDEHGLCRSILGVLWDGFGPVSWGAGLVVIEIGGRAYLCVWDEEESYRLLAAVAPSSATAALRALVTEHLAGGSLVYHVPHYVTNHAPDLLDRAAVEDAFARLLDLTEGWGDLATEHYGRLVEPNHLRRCLDLLDRLPRLDDETSSFWSESDDGSDLPEQARRQLLREFLDSGYREAA
jgi:hypothetical protein